MRHQSSQYRRLNSGKKSLISHEIIAQLEKLRFKCNSDSQLSITIARNERFSNIMKTKKQWRHFGVPQKYTKIPKIAKWVKHQSIHYRLLKSVGGGGSLISEERIAQLENLDSNRIIKNS